LRRPECARRGESLASLYTDCTEETAVLPATESGIVGLALMTHCTTHVMGELGRVKDIRCTGKLDNGRLAGFAGSIRVGPD